MNAKAEQFDIEAHVISSDISYRGGSLKVDVSSLFKNLEEPAVMGAYQNYLGGGIAGAIIGASQFDPNKLSKRDQDVFAALKERIKLYFYELNNGGGDEYMQENVTGQNARHGYAANQSLPKSGY